MASIFFVFGHFATKSNAPGLISRWFGTSNLSSSIWAATHHLCLTPSPQGKTIQQKGADRADASVTPADTKARRREIIRGFKIFLDRGSERLRGKPPVRPENVVRADRFHREEATSDTVAWLPLMKSSSGAEAPGSYPNADSTRTSRIELHQMRLANVAPSPPRTGKRAQAEADATVIYLRQATSFFISQIRRRDKI